MSKKKSTILDEAKQIVYDRSEKDYGHPLDDFTRTARMWSPVLGVEVTPEQVALCLALVKVSRLCNDLKRDSIVDLAGYAATLQRVIDEKNRRAAGGRLAELADRTGKSIKELRKEREEVAE